MVDMALTNKEARHSCSPSRAMTRAKVEHIITDWDRGCFWAGIAFGASIALMGIIGGLLGW